MTRGKLIVISAPSGSGKTTIAKAVMRQYPSMLFSVSATTRKMRGGEVNGKDYFFLTKNEFQDKLKNDALVEWEEIYGDYYGTLRSEVDRALEHGTVMLFDVDVKGGLSIKERYPTDAVLIFIKPPDLESLKQRLVNRKTEDEATIKRRLDRAAMELEMGKKFDYQVTNDDLAKAIGEVDGIVRHHTEGLLVHQSSS